MSWRSDIRSKGWKGHRWQLVDVSLVKLFTNQVVILGVHKGREATWLAGSIAVLRRVISECGDDR